MINQASWCLHVLYTNGFTIDGIDIRALEYIPSSDGIDIDSSNDILITSTRIEAHDDCISIKSGRDEDGRRVGRPSENILIENCHFAYGHGGVAMGSEISGGIRNVTIRSCLMDNENWSPLRFKSQPSRGELWKISLLKILPSKERAVSLISIWNGVWFLRFHLHIIR